MDKPHRFAALDGLRGLAALAVFTGHLEAGFGGVLFMHYGLAVDFFFVLSGFVLAHAYSRKLERGLAPLEFLRLRIIRMYPLYIFGTFLAAAYAAARVLFLDDFPLEAGAYAVMLLCATLFLPTAIEHPERPDLFPFNAPAWSLLFELIANFAFAALARWLTMRNLILIALVGFLAQAVLAIHFGSFSMGWNRATFAGGLARVTFSFFAGVIVYRLWSGRPAPYSIPPLLLMAILLVLIGLPMGGPLRVPYQIAATLAFPPLVYFGASSVARGRLHSVCLEAGALSYALYAVHMPLILIAGSISAKALGAPLEAFAPWSGAALTIAIVTFSAILTRTYDRPARHLLDRLTRTRVAAGQRAP